jgi:hypothetical protein
MHFHEYSNIFPLLHRDDIKKLSLDIKNNGLKHPITLFQGKILDGRNRYLACKKANIKPEFIEYTGKNPIDHVISLNLFRRHLNESQRALVAETIATARHGGNRKDQNANLRLVTINKASQLLNVSPRSVNDARFIRRNVPNLLDDIKTGKKTIHEVKKEFKTRHIPSAGSAKNLIYTSVIGDNDLLMKQAANLYIKKGDVIADLTFGKGIFWKQIDLSNNDFHPSDLKTLTPSRNFKKLPYPNNTFDAVCFDPPFRHNSSETFPMNSNYQNYETTQGLYHSEIMKLYEAGMKESFRILRNNGYLFVKCQDEIESQKQKRSHIHILHFAKQIGFIDQDLFVLTQNRNPFVQYKEQLHARKNHSFMWVFKKRKH